MSTKRWTDKDLTLAVENSFSIAQVLAKLGLIQAGGNYQNIKKHITRLKLDTNHFTGQASNSGSKHRGGPKAIPLEIILVSNSTFSSNKIRKRLIKEGIKSHICEHCKLTEWQGYPIPLELDHINGINNDNRLENLRLLCPNCHAQTETYRGRNIRRLGGIAQLAGGS